MSNENLNIINGEKLVSPLITAIELNNIIGQPNVKIFDVRGIWGTEPTSLQHEYVDGHIPTATFLDWRKEFIEKDVVPNLAQVSSLKEAKQSFIDLGINKEDIVILYDNYHHMFAGRIWWAMCYWGFGNVHVLNGGFNYWQEQGFPVSKEITKIAKGTFEPKPKYHLRKSLEDFLSEKGNSCVLDGRGKGSYNGNPEDPRTGHIPGAISAAYNSFLDKKTRLFLEPSEMIELFERTIPYWRTKKIICSCGAGYSGTIAMLALASLGIESSLFDGSFSVWKLDPTRPIVQSF